ncbi:hypothetical protein [Geodermatophilus chilensis]|uniref:hypothetical protein n=1 Tax=Geodermatophilus chilensis TaxID=2035835 RepID=UPI000C269D21|nr:hypothetical protein [Geodermatophilus chilensis]
MPAAEVAVLVSPAAGRGRARAAAAAVLDVLRAAGLTPRVLPATTRAATSDAAVDSCPSALSARPILYQ